MFTSAHRLFGIALLSVATFTGCAADDDGDESSQSSTDALEKSPGNPSCKPEDSECKRRQAWSQRYEKAAEAEQKKREEAYQRCKQAHNGPC